MVYRQTARREEPAAAVREDVVVPVRRWGELFAFGLVAPILSLMSVAAVEDLPQVTTLGVAVAMAWAVMAGPLVIVAVRISSDPGFVFRAEEVVFPPMGLALRGRTLRYADILDVEVDGHRVRAKLRDGRLQFLGSGLRSWAVHRVTRELLERVAAARRAAGDANRAARLLEELDADHPDLPPLYEEAGQFDDALEKYGRLRKESSEANGEEHPKTRELRMHVARIRRAKRRAEKLARS